MEAARPNLIQVLDNLSFVNRSLVDSQNQLATFLTSSTTSTRELDRLVTDNGDRFIKIAADSLPPLQVGVRYSPEFACLAKGLDKQNGLAENTFGGLQPGLHITLEVVKSQGGYRPGDETAYGADNGPTCFGLPPSAPVAPFPVRDEYKDGYCDDQEKAPGAQTECKGRDSNPSPSGAGLPVPGAGAAPVTGLASDRAAVNAVAGPVMGLSPREVPDLATLLFAPVARGLEIGLSAK